VNGWRTTAGHTGSGLRRSIMIARVIARYGVGATPGEPIYEQTCADVLASGGSDERVATKAARAEPESPSGRKRHG
jgi:hypothetical protein